MAGLISPAAFAAINFDYLIVGGGTAGLALAARLSENPLHQIGVLEAGGDQTNDPNILTPGAALTNFNNPLYDWSFETTTQLNDRVIGHPRGKQLGGSSAINYLYWTHASQLDIDDWGKLGNDNWSWVALEPYFTKSETYHPPTEAQSSQVDTSFFDTALHGTSGPVQDSVPPFFDNFYKSWDPTFKQLGLGATGDPRGGLALGGFTTLVSQAPETATRSYSANAYWKPNANRTNLHVLTNATVTKINFDNSTGTAHAGALFYRANGKNYLTTAKREFILCAGAFQSPQLLELSGVGDGKRLKAQGNDVVIDNPNVGENLQDHLLVPLSYEAAPGEGTFESLRNATIAAAALELYAKNQTGPLAANSCSAYLSLAQIEKSLGTDARNITTPSSNTSRYANTTQDTLTMQKLRSPTEASVQIVYLAGGSTPSKPNNATALFSTTEPSNYFTFFSVLEHPFSRGSVHINSSDPFAYPSIDPNYLSNPLDAYVVGQGLLQIQKIATTAPLSQHFKDGGTVYQPPYSKLDEGNVEDFVRHNFASEYHPMGTCSMLPRNKGGVVDARFKVHGTDNLRVVDASIFPLAPRGNLQTLVYAIAERAADFIKGDAK